jgi:hypothetical protein
MLYKVSAIFYLQLIALQAYILIILKCVITKKTLFPMIYVLAVAAAASGSPATAETAAVFPKIKLQNLVGSS